VDGGTSSSKADADLTVYISPCDQRRVWVVDDMRHGSSSLERREDAVQTIGTPDESATIRHPLSASDGHRLVAGRGLLVSDGYGNKRVVKFDKNGKFLKER
jgi:hypothetical protein